MITPEEFFDTIKKEIVSSFSKIPEYGALSLTVYLVESAPVRFEYMTSESKKLLPKQNRGMK